MDRADAALRWRWARVSPPTCYFRDGFFTVCKFSEPNSVIKFAAVIDFDRRKSGIGIHKLSHASQDRRRAAMVRLLDDYTGERLTSLSKV
jgi:hypothetical protein